MLVACQPSSGATALDDPRSWAAPKLIVPASEGWYPQVIGTTPGEGTDSLSSAVARYFIQGKSTSFITFEDSSVPPAIRAKR
jgi:hypothetical protein